MRASRALRTAARRSDHTESSQSICCLLTLAHPHAGGRARNDLVQVIQRAAIWEIGLFEIIAVAVEAHRAHPLLTIGVLQANAPERGRAVCIAILVQCLRLESLRNRRGREPARCVP